LGYYCYFQTVIDCSFFVMEYYNMCINSKLHSTVYLIVFIVLRQGFDLSCALDQLKSFILLYLFVTLFLLVYT